MVVPVVCTGRNVHAHNEIPHVFWSINDYNKRQEIAPTTSIDSCVQNSPERAHVTGVSQN
jgi:hypothetical protein